MSPFEILLILFAFAALGVLAARERPHPQPPELAAVARALAEGQTKRDQDFLLHARLLTEKVIASNAATTDKSAVLLQAMLLEHQKATMIGGVPLALEEQKIALESARLEHARKTREEDLEAFKIAARSGAPVQIPNGAPAAKNPLA